MDTNTEVTANDTLSRCLTTKAEQYLICPTVVVAVTVITVTTTTKELFGSKDWTKEVVIPVLLYVHRRIYLILTFVGLYGIGMLPV